MAVGAGRGLSHVARLPVMSGLFTVRRAQEATRHHQEHRCGSWQDVRRLAALTSHQPKGITMQEQKWEYQVTSEIILTTRDPKDYEKGHAAHMNRQAAKGWELVGPPIQQPTLDSDLFQFWYWKRPV